MLFGFEFEVQKTVATTILIHSLIRLPECTTKHWGNLRKLSKWTPGTMVQHWC